MNMRRFIAGDPLRGYACLLVIFFHAFASAASRFAKHGDKTAYDDFGGAVPYFFRFDTLVWIFFVLSAYLLSRPYFAALVRDRPLPSLRQYLYNRALRVLPTFWVVAAIVLLVWGSNGGGVRDVVGLFALAQSYGTAFVQGRLEQTWTVGTEFVFYLVLPAIAFLIARAGFRGRRAVPVIIAVLAALFVGSLLLRTLEPRDIAWQRTFPPMAFAFVPGMALALFEVLRRDRLQGAAWGPRVALGMLTAAAVLYVVSAEVRWGNPAIVGLVVAVTATLVVGSTLVLQWTAGRAWWVFDNRVAHWLGTRSYPIYVVHVPLGFVFSDVTDSGANSVQGWLLLLCVLLPSTLVVAELLHRAVERPLLQRRRQWRQPVYEPAPAAGVPTEGEPAPISGHAAR